mmetsp:Transcript_17446/g.30059  ORF Transcript_17446/g.30059 Transcript_17446/m.30059 type:complete len:173 (-) Transcript_17446:422-940(-)
MCSPLIIQRKKSMDRKMLEPRKKRSTNAKRLRFSEFSQLVLMPPKSREDISNSWYAKKQISQFKKNVRLTSMSLRQTRTAKAMVHIAHSIATGSPQPNIHIHGKEVIHGIEHLISPEVTKYMLERRKTTIARVLQAQKMDVQWRQHYIAKVSEINSKFSKEWSSHITQFRFT